MGDYQMVAAQVMILIQIAIGGAAFWGVCRLTSKLCERDAPEDRIA